MLRGVRILHLVYVDDNVIVNEITSERMLLIGAVKKDDNIIYDIYYPAAVAKIMYTNITPTHLPVCSG